MNDGQDSDGLDLKEVRIHPRQRTILCPRCKTEGRNFLIRGSFHSKSTLPGNCRECGEVFVIHITEDPEMEEPLRTLAMAIHHASSSWDNKNLDVVNEIKGYIETVVRGIPGMHAMKVKPMFKVRRNEHGNPEVLPTNNTALRTMEILDEIRKRTIDTQPAIDDLQGI